MEDANSRQLTVFLMIVVTMLCAYCSGWEPADEINRPGAALVQENPGVARTESVSAVEPLAGSKDGQLLAGKLAVSTPGKSGPRSGGSEKGSAPQAVVGRTRATGRRGN